ncbi:unnamed protein product, partial [Diamesa tonsa]
MKFIFLVVALSCLSFVVTKPLDDVERKCIVKYLSDKELLDSSFVVDPVLPDNCDELISAKIFEIYFDIIYDGIKPEEGKWSYSEHVFRRSGVADVVLKSLLSDQDSEKANDLKETVKQMRTIADLFKMWSNYKLFENFKTLQIESPGAETELCLKNYVTFEVLSSFVGKDRSEQLEKYDINDLECDKLITLFQKQLEVHLLQILPKLSTDKENICMKKVYVNSNMTQTFSDVFIFSMMEDINVDDVYRLYNSYSLKIETFYELSMECARLGFILKDVPEVRNVYSIDFTRQSYMFSDKYEENFGILVKLNTNRSLNEIRIIANQTSKIMNNSQCFINSLKGLELSEMSLKMMAAEDNYEVVRIMAMKTIMTKILSSIKDFCEMNNDNSKMFDDMLNELRINKEEILEIMTCFQEFVTEEKVNGITYFRVNLDGQLNDKKCKKVLDQLEQMEKSLKTVPEEKCSLLVLKNSNGFKLMLQMTVLAELGIYNCNQFCYQRNGVADVVLESLFYDQDSEEAKDLKETIKQMRSIADMIDLWDNYKLNENVENLKIKSPDSETELCLKNYVTSEIFPNYVETKSFEQLEKYDIKNLECDKLITAFKNYLEVQLLEKLPKFSTDKENTCVKNIYVNLNMTQTFSDVFAFSIMKDINVDDTYRLYNSYCLKIVAFYEMTLECSRLGFILKDAPEVRKVFSIDFTRQRYLFSNNYKENFGIIVKFHTNRSLDEFLIIADEISHIKKNSQCLINHLNNFESSDMFLKMMTAEDNYEVDRLRSMKKLMKEIFNDIKRSCEINNDFSASFYEKFNVLSTDKEEISEIMNCLQEFVTEEKVNGITYFRVNIDGQLNDKKCKGVLYQLEQMEKSLNTDPKDICIRRELKKLNYFKLMFKLRVFAELGISPQQEAEEKTKYNDLMLKIIEMHFK